MHDLAPIARRALPLLDLTRLEPDNSPQPVVELCRRAQTSFGCVAAVCVYPQFVPTARRILAESGVSDSVAVATVANFPGGDAPPDVVLDAVRDALRAGADEIDLVFPWRALQGGDAEPGRQLVAAVRGVCEDHRLKVILETGELGTPERIRQAAEIALDCGADFLKTSTGKVPVNATPEAVRILLETIRASDHDAGCKVSGGVSTTRQAGAYLELADEIMGPDWVSPRHFRFGASSLLDDLIDTLEGTRHGAGGPR